MNTVVKTRLAAFAIIDESLSVFLTSQQPLRGNSKWQIPGSPLKGNEDLERSARRQIDELMITSPRVFGNVDLKQFGSYGPFDACKKNQEISVVYISPIPKKSLKPADIVSGKWFQMDDLPELAPHQRKILLDVRSHLARLATTKKSVQNLEILSFLPPKFTLSEVQNLFEVVSKKSIDRRNLRRWMNYSPSIKVVQDEKITGRHRAASLFALT